MTNYTAPFDQNMYCPQLQDVLDVPVAVAAVTDPTLGDLNEFLSGLAGYEHPRALEIVDSTPRNTADNLLTTELRTYPDCPAIPINDEESEYL